MRLIILDNGHPFVVCMNCFYKYRMLTAAGHKLFDISELKGTS